MEKENQIILAPRRYQTFSQVRWRASDELNLGRVSPFLQDSLDLISPPQFVACVMAVGLLDVRNITISKKKVPLPSKNSFSAYGLCCQGKARSECSLELHMQATRPKECGTTSLSSSSKNQLARIMYKTSLSWRGASDAAEIGDDVPVAYRGTSRTPERRFIHVDVA